MRMDKIILWYTVLVINIYTVSDLNLPFANCKVHWAVSNVCAGPLSECAPLSHMMVGLRRAHLDPHAYLNPHRSY